MLAVLPQAQAAGQQAQEDAQLGQGSIFDIEEPGGGSPFLAKEHPPVPALEDDRKALNEMEKETLGLFLSSHPLKEVREATHVIRELANCRPVVYKGTTLQFPWARTSSLEVWVAAYGPLALRTAGEVGDGFILQLADVDIASWMIESVRTAASNAGRDPMAITFCVAAPMYVGDDLAHQRDQCRWFGGMVGNHVADIVAKYGDSGPGASTAVPRALTDYIKGRQGYDYNEHGQAGNTHTDFVPDEIVDRFCILGPVDQHVHRLRELEDLGVDQFAIYLQHDGKDPTLQAYGEHVIPALTATGLAKQ